MPFTSMILPRTLSTGHAWLSKRVGRSKTEKGDAADAALLCDAPEGPFRQNGPILFRVVTFLNVE